MSQDNIVNLLCNLSYNDNVAFDFDGTIVDCEIRQIEVLRSILRRKEFKYFAFNYDKWWNYKTNGLSTYNALIKMNVFPDQAYDISAGWMEIVENPEWLDLDKLRNYVIPLFKKLKEMNKSIFIITARKSEYFFLNQIKKLSIDNYIKKYFVVHPFKSREHKKEILNILKPSFFVGDSENDQYSAQKSGVKFIAISGGQRSDQYFIKNGISPVISDISLNRDN